MFNQFFSTMSYDDIDNANLEQADKSEAAHFVWQYFAVTNNIDARKGCTKNAVCMFSGCSISRADSIFLLWELSFISMLLIRQALQDRREHVICWQNPLQCYKVHSQKWFSLSKHTSQLSNLWPLFLLLWKGMEQIFSSDGWIFFRWMDWSYAYKKKAGILQNKQCGQILQRCQWGMVWDVLEALASWVG